MAKRTRKTDKARQAKAKRQAKNPWRDMDTWPFLFRNEPPQDPELVNRIAPLYPSVAFGSQAGGVARMEMSPGRTYQLVAAEGLSSDALSIIARWPFRRAVSGQPSPCELTSLSIHAWDLMCENGMPVDVAMAQAAEGMVEAEDHSLLVWVPEDNVIVVSPEVPDLSTNPDVGMRQVDELLSKIAAEPASVRSQRRWFTPEVVRATDGA